MNVPFPFGFPFPTAFYLTLYVLTFVLHHVFMHYVLAGSLYVAWATVWPGHAVIPRTEQPLAATLRDWMPFLLSAAITAGVAPLLFIQIVYQHQFYTANLLLWWRWMIVVPVLIGAFYLLYLIKSSMLWKWSYPARVAVTVGTSLCFVFVGFCWTANHLLSCSESTWAEFYTTGQLPFHASAIIPRMLVWIGGSFATMSVIVGWQLFYRQGLLEKAPTKNETLLADVRLSVRTTAELTGGGMIVAFLAGIICFAQTDASSRSILFGRLISPYLLVTLVGIVLQGIGWRLQWRTGRFHFVGLVCASVGTAFGLLGVSVVREGLRLRSVDLVSLAQRHADAATVGGFWVFVVAAVLVSVLIAWCVRVVQASWLPE